MIEWLISLISGAAGGNAAGFSLKKLNLGLIWNSIVGILGGGLGKKLLEIFGNLSTTLGDTGADVAAGAGGGGILMVIVGLIKKFLFKSASPR